jgi:hypothetical protein
MFAPWWPPPTTGTAAEVADRVIVIGAGIAGLTIGNALTTAGVDNVVLVEAVAGVSLHADDPPTSRSPIVPNLAPGSSRGSCRLRQ